MKDLKPQAQRIYEELRDRVCLLDYAPGTALRERDLAIEFEVSRTPLRGVLQRLENDGLIRSRHGHGTFVTEIDLASLFDVYFLRMKLAELIGSSGPFAPTEQAIAILDDLAHRCRSATEPNHRLFAEINIGLHKQYQGVIRNRPLREFSDRLFYQTARVWFLLLPTADWREEIGDLLEEIQAVRRYFRLGNVDAAGFLHRNHLSTVMRRLDGLIAGANQPEPVSRETG